MGAIAARGGIDPSTVDGAVGWTMKRNRDLNRTMSALVAVAALRRALGLEAPVQLALTQALSLSRKVPVRVVRLAAVRRTFRAWAVETAPLPSMSSQTPTSLLTACAGTEVEAMKGTKSLIPVLLLAGALPASLIHRSTSLYLRMTSLFLPPRLRHPSTSVASVCLAMLARSTGMREPLAPS